MNEVQLGVNLDKIQQLSYQLILLNHLSAIPLSQNHHILIVNSLIGAWSLVGL